jgi:low temperature requirement protein LtrA
VASEDARQRVRAGLRTWFRSPPRAHGDVVYTREVSFLELFYDLVYVVVIGRAAHHLAEHVDWSGVRDFVVVFGLIWLSWFNGTFWHELHSREDGRSRSYIFVQMGLLSLLAVFTGEATGEDGRAFAITYAVLFVVFTWQWRLVHRIDHPDYRSITTRYLAAMALTVVTMAASAFAPEAARVWIWACVVAGWLVGGLVMMSNDRTAGFGEGVTSSLVERVGLFTIIVLGEVVVGVVAGISDAEERSTIAVVTGIAGLVIGMGVWWNYFDMLGRRVPRHRGARLAGWLFAHLPLTMAIAAGGAAMVSLVEHAEDARTPAGTAWLLSGSVAVVLGGITLAARALPHDEFPRGMTGQIAPTFGAAAAGIVGLGAIRPSPLLLVVAIVLVLSLAWFRLFVVFLARGGELSRIDESGFGSV